MYQNPRPKSEGESAWGGEDLKASAKDRTAIPDRKDRAAIRDRKGLDLRRCGTRGEPNFPDSDGPRKKGCEPQGFSVSPDAVRERSVIVEQMRMYVCTGGSVENKDVGAVDALVPNKYGNHLSIRRIRDGGVSRIVPGWSFPPDDAGYSTCLEVPANDRYPLVLMIVIHTIVAGAR